MDSSHLAQISDSTVDTKEALYLSFQRENFEDTVSILRNHPELINCELNRNDFFGTPLLLACKIVRFNGSYGRRPEDCYEIFHFMLDNGADPNCLGYWIWAADNYPDFGYQRYNSRIPLMVAAADRNLSLIEILLNAGAKINQTNSIGQTTLHVSCLGTVQDKRGNIIKKLLSHNADVNVQDVHGRTALHYACENIGIDAIDLLLESGAQLNIVDNSGFTELELAAQSDWDPIRKVERLMDSYDYPIEKVIEAYEAAAWSLLHLQDTGAEWGHAVDCMRKATIMRMEHNIPKEVSDPLECYGFAKEWETIEELSRFENSIEEIKLQAMLSRERIYRGRHRLIPFRQYISFSRFLPLTERQLDALLLHILDLYEETSVDTPNTEGYKVLLYFHDLLATWFEPIFSRYLESRHEFEDFDTSSIAKTVLVLTGNCQRMKSLLEKETEILPARELVDCLDESIFILTGIIMKLYKRDSSTFEEENLAKQMLTEVLSKIGDVVSHRFDFRSPVQHIIFKNHIETFCLETEFKKKLFQDIDICYVLFDCIQDIDATDGNGDTLLLLVARQICNDQFPIPLNILKSLVCRGAYIYARNSEGMTVFDYLAESDESNDEISRLLRMPQSKVLPLQTLSAIVANDLISTKDISEPLKRFINLHRIRPFLLASIYHQR